MQDSSEFLQDFSYLARKASLLLQDLQGFVPDLASFAREILARLGYFLQDGFYWVCTLTLNVTSMYSHEYPLIAFLARVLAFYKVILAGLPSRICQYELIKPCAFSQYVVYALSTWVKLPLSCTVASYIDMCQCG